MMDACGCVYRRERGGDLGKFIKFDCTFSAKVWMMCILAQQLRDDDGTAGIIIFELCSRWPTTRSESLLKRRLLARSVFTGRLDYLVFCWCCCWWWMPLKAFLELMKAFLELCFFSRWCGNCILSLLTLCFYAIQKWTFHYRLERNGIMTLCCCGLRRNRKA